MNRPIRALLVDDHAIVREGYKRLLHDSGQVVVVGEAADADHAYELFCNLHPNVVVMDITLHNSSGIAALKRIRAQDARARVLVFSMHEDAIFAIHAQRAGALGYITKSSAPTVLVEAVRAVAGGRRYLGDDIAGTMASGPSSDGAEPLDSLTDRELEILRLSLSGMSPETIADNLKLSRKSVANQRWNIKQKVGVDNFLQLVPIALRLGLISEAPPPSLPADS
ncbi:MAG TPA: response regulator transcription factor [Nevskiaceae bacterium]|nr:response regulator transcription factor [Nevskiaceae bacterium]